MKGGLSYTLVIVLIGASLHRTVFCDDSVVLNSILERLTSLETMATRIDYLETALTRIEKTLTSLAAITCGVPPDEENMVCDVTDAVSFPDTVTYHCANGYVSNGASGVRNCQNNGEWTPLALICTAVRCGMPRDRFSMKFKFDYPGPGVKVYYLGAPRDYLNYTVTYSCKKGHNSNGESGITRCQEDGQWSEPALVCTLPTARDCEDINGTSGVYNILPRRRYSVEPVSVFCDKETDGGDWTVLLRAPYSELKSLNIYRDQQSGSLNGSFWIGTEKIVYIMSNKDYQLRVDVDYLYEDQHLHMYAHYDQFRLEAMSYKLYAYGFTGNAPYDALARWNGYPFQPFWDWWCKPKRELDCEYVTMRMKPIHI